MANPKHLEILKQGVEAWNAWRGENADTRIKLTGALLREMDLDGIDLSDADLSGADLNHSSLEGANLSGSKFKHGNLGDVNLKGANLNSAKLHGADIYAADFTGAELIRTEFARAYTGCAIFGDVDLSSARHLDSVTHLAPSTIGIDTIYKSKGKIPEIFLRGCGVPENFIEYMGSLTGAAFEYYSCFISHASKDMEFTQRLYNDMQGKGVRCWFAQEDLKIGEKTRQAIEGAIHLYDKLLIILSKHSIASDWVANEVETAMERERREKRAVLFPVRIDDAVMSCDEAWAAALRRERHIGDFRDWKHHDAYTKGFERLLRDLKAA